MTKTFNVLIATIARPSLQNMLNTLAPQLNEYDCLTIVFDGHSSIPNFNLSQIKCKIHQYFEPVALGHYGHGIRNKYAPLLEKRDFVMHADDDDIYLPNSFDQLRNLCIDSDVLYIGKISFSNSKLILPPDHSIRPYKIGTPCGIIPFENNKKSWWDLKYGGDGGFYHNLQKVSPKIVYLEVIMYMAFPSTKK
jgi:hypothetical protein